MPRYGHHILEFLYDTLRLIWGDPSSRIPRLLIVSGVTAIVLPWWLPIVGEIATSYLGLERDRLARFDNAVFWSGWVLVLAGVILWVRYRTSAAGPPVAEARRYWRSGTQRLAEKLSRQLTRLRYKSSQDVRPPIEVKPGVHVVAGESGQGKTWRLARTASHFSRQGGAVAWVGGHMTLADIELEVAHIIWNEGFEGNSYFDLSTLSRHLQEARGTNSIPWLLVCLDETATFDDAQALCHLDWESRGITLLLSSTNDVAERLERRELATIHRVSDFSLEELREFLKAHGKKHLSIANDVEQMIRRPVLAAVYVRANPSPEWVPSSEYALLDDYWRSIDDPAVKSTLQRLGDTLLDDHSAYPWNISHLVRSGISHDDIKRLIDGGILRHAQDGCVDLWHHRLLAWSYADALARGWEAGRLTTDELSEAFVHCFDYSQQPRLPSIEYAAMDAMWLVCGGERENQWKLLAAVDQTETFRHRAESLYEDLLGTLGPRVIEPIIDRIRESGDPEGNEFPRLGCAALTAIGETFPDEVIEATTQCLREEHSSVLKLGLLLAKRFPCPEEIDRLWSVHLVRVKARERGVSGFNERQLSQAAFRAAVKLRPDWLDMAVSDSESDPPALVELAYTLANTSDSPFDKLWRAHKVLLFRKVPSDRRRSLAACIFRFRDLGELKRLEEWVTDQTDMLGSTCIQVLGFFDPQRAAAALPRLPVKHLGMISKALGQSLFTGNAAAIREEAKRLVAAHPDNAWSYLKVYETAGDHLDSETSNIILDKLQSDLARFDNLDRPTVQNRLLHALQFVGSLHGRVFLASLRSRRGSRLENLLTEFAIARADNDSAWFDHEYDYAKQILKRIAGEGFTRLTNALLRANAIRARWKGAEQAVLRPDTSTLALLEQVALDDRLWESSKDGFPLVQREAMNSLAALQRNRSLTTAVLKWGTQISPDLCEIRSHQPPMADDEIAPAIVPFEDPHHPNHLNALIAVGLSGRTEYAASIADIFNETSPSSPRALTSMLALEDLNCDLNPIRERLAAQWKSGEHKFAALKLLLVRPEQWPKGFLLDLVPPDRRYDEMDERLLGFLHSQEETRIESRSRLREHFNQTSDGQQWHYLDSNLALDPHDADDFEALWHRCRVPHGQFVFGSSRAAAIRRLAEAEVELATQLSAAALTHDDDSGIQYLDILLEFGGDDGIRKVCDSAINSRKRVRCRAAGLIIRKHSLQQKAAVLLRDGLKDTDWKCRRSAAMLAGYLGQGQIEADLLQVIREDGNWSVCVEAQQALRRLQMEEEAKCLAVALEMTSGEELWGSMDCILRLVDPDYLFMQSDPLGVRSFLDEAPPHVLQYLERATKKRREEVENDLESLHGKWKDDD